MEGFDFHANNRFNHPEFFNNFQDTLFLNIVLIIYRIVLCEITTQTKSRWEALAFLSRSVCYEPASSHIWKSHSVSLHI